MPWILVAGWVVFAALGTGALWFTLTFLFEGERRPAAITGLAGAAALAVVGGVLLVELPGREWIVLALLAALALAAVLVAAVGTRAAGIRVVGEQERVDERDALFHRFYRLEPGTPEFAAYYERYPDKLAFDEKVRALPPLGGPGSRTYDPVTSPYQVACFESIEEISRAIEWEPRPIEGAPVPLAPDEASRRIKGFARYLGAHAVGCAVLDQAHVYSNIGRAPGPWGHPVELDHSHAIALAVPMDHAMVRHAPAAPTITETAFEYLKVGQIALVLARYLNLLGYRARAHVDGNYRVLCVPIAAAAGLGELGRLGLLITPDLGPRVRLAVVTTDLPLAPDEPVTFGVQDFCEFCRKCAEICPSGSIDKGDKRLHRGVEKWRSEQDACYRYWRTAGSDCSLCLKVCPYSHPGGPAHDLVRWLTRRNHLARRLALWADDLAYGRRPRATYPPPDWH
jgi:ferredoxin